MTVRFALLSAAAYLAASAAPAMAQQVNVPAPAPAPPQMQSEAFDGAWTGGWVSPGVYRGTWQGTYTDANNHQVRGETQRAQLVQYSQAERDAWLADCRSGFDRYDASKPDDGGAVGALLGAVVGGFAGNAVAGHGDKLAGTVVGAGLGGIGGALIGSAIGARAGAHAHDGAYGEAECEDYLNRWQAQQGAPAYMPYGYGAYPLPGPVMWVRVPIVRESGPSPRCHAVIEEEIDQPAPAPTARRTIPPRRHTKLVPVAPQRQGKLTPTP